MVESHTDPIPCSKCGIPGPKDKWSSIRLHSLGWFFARDGTPYCPDCKPEWVDGWRARMKAASKGGTNAS